LLLAGDASYFMFNKLNDKESQLILQKEVVAKSYRVCDNKFIFLFFSSVASFAIISFIASIQIYVIATDDSGSGRSSSFANIQVSFIDMNDEPFFDEKDDVANTDFTGMPMLLVHMEPSQV
jgi:hypothetical protein